MKALIISLLLIVVFVECNIKEPVSTDPNGVGPIISLELEPIKDSLMKVGMQSFKDRCSQCHTMEYKNSGPDISDVLAIRKPEWIVNFLVNKEEMLQRDTLAIKARLKYESDCGAELINQTEALELLEYLRIYQIWLHEFNIR